MSENPTSPGTAEPARSSIWGWWKGLDEDRAGRAELRLCATVEEVAFTAPYHRLLRRLGSRLREGDARRVAAAAAVIANVDVEPAARATLARQMGSPRGAEGGSVVSDARFRHLIRSEDAEDLMRELIRVVRQVGRAAAVEPLFLDLVRWDEATRIRWARDYYEAAPDPKKS